MPRSFMASPVQICSRALSAIGSQAIASLDDRGNRAQLCKAFYPQLRDELLIGHRWKFAEARVTLAASADAPAFGWQYAYPLPPACLRVVWAGGEDFDRRHWKEEGGALLTNLGAPLDVLIVQQVEDTGLFPATFVTALVARLAMELAMPVAQSASTRQQQAQAMEVALTRARGVDIVEEKRRERHGSWIAARW